MKELFKDLKLRFTAGMIMLIVGLWMFIKKVYVASNFFSSGLQIGSLTLRSGILVIPLLAGLIWMFFAPKNKVARILSIAGVVVIVGFAISSVNIRVSHISIARWILILFLIAVGAGFVVSAIFEKRKEQKAKKF